MGKKQPQHVASDAWDWLKDAEAAYHQAEDNSPEQMAAIQAMAMVSLCGLVANYLDDR